MSVAKKYVQELGLEIAEILGPSYKFFKSTEQLRSEIEGGLHVVSLSGSNKFSPYIEIAFFFGKNFAAVRGIEKILGITPFYRHIQQYSVNCLKINGNQGNYSWSVNVLQPPPNLAADVAKSIVELSEPFLERYGSLQAARNAIASDDPNVFGGPVFWRQLLLLDLVLDDLPHFERWATQLDTLSKSQAEELIQKYRELRVGC